MKTDASLIKYCSLLLTLIVCALVVLNGFASDHGCLSPDSTKYLSLAQRLLSDGSFKIPNSARGTADLTHFAVWPVGYPTMIAVVAGAVDIQVFTAARVLNVILFLSSVVTVWRVFGKHGPLLAMALCSGGTIVIFSYTWSEAPFILFLICFSAATFRSVKNLRELGSTDVVLLIGLALSLFLIRYIGVFSLGVILSISAYSLYLGHRRSAAKLFSGVILLLIVVTSYLGFNKVETGWATGMPRIPAPENSIELIKQLSMAVVRELVIPLPSFNPQIPEHSAVAVIYFGLFLVFAHSTIRHRRLVFGFHKHLLSVVFVLIGLLYLGAIVFTRWSSQFDAFDFRLLNPGFVLIWLGLCNFALETFRKRYCLVVASLFCTAIASISVNVYSLVYKRTELNFSQATALRMSQYERVPDGAIVIFGNIHMNYLRPDLYIVSPRFRPYFADDEPWEEFLSDLDRTRGIYVDIGDRANLAGKYHASVKDFVSRNRGRELFRLN